jgi:hypothetical protein
VIREFVEFDDVHTGAPAALQNGWLLSCARKAIPRGQNGAPGIGAPELLRAVERSLSPQEPEERPICELSLCDGGGELRENGKYWPCDCAAGQSLSPQVKELMEQMRQSVA